MPGKTGMGARKFDYHARLLKNKHKPPRGMFLNREGLVAIATGPVSQGDIILKQHQVELVGLKRQVKRASVALLKLISKILRTWRYISIISFILIKLWCRYMKSWSGLVSFLRSAFESLLYVSQWLE